MISVPSLLQRLSGNNIILILLTSIVTLLSCSTTKPVYSPGKINTPEPVQDVLVEQKMDTVVWEITPEEEMPPITSERFEEPSYEKKDLYNVAMFLPIEAQKDGAEAMAIKENSTTNRFVSFYAGALMALVDLENEGVNLRVDVYDSQRSVEKVSRELNSLDFRNMDAIIGPYGSNRNKQGLVETAEFGKENEITVVSPWYASSSLAKANPYYVQLRPNLIDHFQRMLKHAKENFEDDEILLLGRDHLDARKQRSDANLIATLQRLHKEISGNMSTSNLRVFDANPDSLSIGETAFDSLFYEPGRKAVIIPYFASSDESFIYNSLRRINGEKAFEPVHVYAMPIVLESEQIGFNLYRNLNMKICRSKFVDRVKPSVKNFEREYFARFGAIPNNHAYHGYDVMFFVGANLYNYGRNFQFFVDEPQEYLQSSFRLEKVPLKDAPSNPELSDEMMEFNYFVNKHLDIIEFEGEYFKKTE